MRHGSTELDGSALESFLGSVARFATDVYDRSQSSDDHVEPVFKISPFDFAEIQDAFVLLLASGGDKPKSDSKK